LPITESIGYTLAVTDSLLVPVRRPFRALATVFIPELAAIDEASWERVERIVADALASRPPALRRQILLFLRILDTLSLLRHRRRLAALDDRTRTTFVAGIASSPVLLLRRGVWGLRTLVQMGWYSQPDVQQALGYRARAGGWSGRR
jgi:hypothetical protein